MKCECCEDSGEYAYSIRTGNWRAPGPVPDDARNVGIGICRECDAHWIIRAENDDARHHELERASRHNYHARRGFRHDSG